jgi:hypothetical protein
MVIPANLGAATGVLLAKSNDRPNSKRNTANSSAQPSPGTAAVPFGSRLEATLASTDSDIEKSHAARQSRQLLIASMLGQPSMALRAQANLSSETVLNLLRE